MHFSYAITNANVQDYAVFAVRNYLTFEDQIQSLEYGMVSTRLVETYIEPGYSIDTKGSRDMCTDNPRSITEKACTIALEYTSEYFMDADGDGFNLYNFLDLWGSIWDTNGNYIYMFPEDSCVYPKEYNYQGEFAY